MSAAVTPLRAGTAPGADEVLAATLRCLRRCKLSANTVRAYERQCRAFAAWLLEHQGQHPDAFADVVGAEAAVTAWRRHLLARRRGPSTVNQALAAVTLMYEHGARIRIDVKRARVPRPGQPVALTVQEQGALERAAERRGPRDEAIIKTFLYTGARVEEAARLEDDDFAITPRTGTVRLFGKGDQVRTVPIPVRGRAAVSAWLLVRPGGPGPVWVGTRGPLTIAGLTQVVLAAGEDAGIPGLRPQRLRHTYATRLRQGGADPAQVQACLGHASLETTGRYFRAGPEELAAVTEQIFGE